MDGYVTETESDYVSYWRDWVRHTPFSPALPPRLGFG
jgi:hypothetical protein